MRSLFNFFSKDVGIDLGTANTLVYVQGQGIVVNEPSVVAIDQKSQEVMAIGNDAYEMVGRTPGNIVAVRPMKDGVIANFDIAEKMIRAFITKTKKIVKIGNPRILIGVPWGITDVEKRAVIDSANQAGAREVILIEEPMAAAVGAGIDVLKPEGRMVIDIGGGTTEIAVISLGGIVVCKSSRIAGDEFTDAIIQHCRKSYNLLIGERMAENIKFDIGSAYPLHTELELKIRGRDLLNGLPKTFTISSMEIRDAISECVSTLIDAVKITLENTPPELAGDIYQNGIILTGGGALIKNLDKRITHDTGLPVIIATDPLSCVAVGTGKILENNLLDKITIGV
jgi:rod shape-determining protein MreB